MKKVVVTGLGVVSPAGSELKQFWNQILSGKSFISAYDKFPDKEMHSRITGQVKDFELKENYLTQEEKERCGRETLYAIAATEDALRDSKINLQAEDHERIGACIGNAIGDTPFCEQEFMKIAKHADETCADATLSDNHLFEKGMFHCISTAIAARYHLNGEVFTMSTGCTSGIDAVGFGYETIQTGEADIMICGASEAPNTLMTISSFDAIHALSCKNEEPEKASSPFDLNRDGFVLSEGCGILILEEYEHARKRGASVYGEIRSFVSSNNAWHMTDLPADGKCMASLLRRAIEDAGILPEAVDYISAHGSSTVQNDRFETQAYKEVFGEAIKQIPVSSMKSIFGHPLGAATAVELVGCFLILKNGKIPPTVNLNHPDPVCDLDYVPNVYREKEVNTLLKDGSGFSGIHSAMIISKLSECVE